MKDSLKSTISIKNTAEMDNMIRYLQSKWLLNPTAVMRHALAVAYDLEMKKDQGDSHG